MCLMLMGSVQRGLGCKLGIRPARAGGQMERSVGATGSDAVRMAWRARGGTVRASGNLSQPMS